MRQSEQERLTLVLVLFGSILMLVSALALFFWYLSSEKGQTEERTEAAAQVRSAQDVFLEQSCIQLISAIAQVPRQEDRRFLTQSYNSFVKSDQASDRPETVKYPQSTTEELAAKLKLNLETSLRFLAQALFSRDYFVAGSAATLLGYLGERACSEPIRINRSQGTLRVSGPSIDLYFADGNQADKPPLLYALRHRDAAIVKAAVNALRLRKNQAGPKLKDLVNHNQPRVRECAILALRKVGQPFEKGTGLMESALYDENPQAQREAVLALKQAKGDAKAALPALLLKLKKSYGRNKLEILSAIEEIAPHDRTIIPALFEQLNDSNKAVRDKALEMLLAFSPPPAELLPKLLVSHRNDEKLVYYIKKFEDASYPTIAVLREIALSSGKSSRRMAAMELLAQRAPNAETARMLASLLHLHCPNELGIIRKAVGLLGSLGPAAKAEVSELIWALDRGCDLSVRLKAISSLGSVGPSAYSALPRLNELFFKYSGYQRLSVVSAIASIGGFTQSLLEKVSILLSDSNHGVRRRTLDLVQKYSTSCRSLYSQVDDLSKKDTNKYVRKKAAETLPSLEQ